MFMLTDSSPDWSTATCVQLAVDPETMQPERALAADVERAKALCGGCAMFIECRALADAQAEPYGIHAGEWRGPEPVWLTECAADGCAEPAARRYCSGRCRKAASRAAQAIPA